MIARVRVYVPKFLQCRMQVVTKNVGQRQRCPVLGLEQESAGARPDEALQQFRDIRMKIDLPLGTPRLNTILDAAPPCLLLDVDRRAVRREVLVDFDPKRLPYTEAACRDDEYHLFPRPVMLRQ